MQLQGEGEAHGTSKACYRNQPYLYSSPADCVRKIWRHENNIRGMYRGLGVTLVREVPAFALWFGSYFYLCDVMDATTDSAIDIAKLLFAGGMAGITSWVFTYPQDVIKTRLQLDGMGSTTYLGAVDCARCIYKDEGVRGFFKGLNATVVRAFPYNAATMATATLFLRYALRDNDNIS